MILETSGLTKSFGAILANDNVDLSVNEGEIHGIIGPNGAGKSTFFNVVTGYHEPDKGTVTFRGTDITGWPPSKIAQQGLVRTFQITSPFDEMTVEENLLATYSRGLRVGSEKRDRAREVLELLDIEHQAEKNAEDLSGGQQKLLELGRVLMLDPDCILLDEPTAGVNPALQRTVLDHLETLNDRGTTLVVIEHDMKVINEITDRVTVFNQGRPLVEGAFEEIRDDRRVREAYLGSAATDEGAVV